MNLGLNEEQVHFQDALRRQLARSASFDALRRFTESGADFDEALWRGLVEQGVTGILVPEAFGGSGLGLLDAAVAAEALGSACVPAPFTGCAVMATQALLHSAEPRQQQAWLPRIAAGEVRIAVAFAGSLSGQTGQGRVRFDGTRLAGRIETVLEAGSATHFIVYLADGQAVLLAAGSKGVAIERHKGVDPTRGTTHVAFDAAIAEPLSAAAEPAAASRHILDSGRLMLAADSLGAAQSMLDASLVFARERVQFGRPVGSFQGVKYMCADMVTQLEPCRALVWDAALAPQPFSSQARVAALQAKAHVSDVCREVSRMAIEVHGGMGFTELLGLHYGFKRIAFNRQLLGGAERCRQEAAQVQGWAPLASVASDN